MQVAILVPAPDYPEPWRWTYDPQAQALIDAGARVEPVAWTAGTDLSRFDLVLPLVAWGYHQDYPRWLHLLDEAERKSWPMLNPPPLLRWNGDKRYLVELERRGVPTVPTRLAEACSEMDVQDARKAFGADRLVIKPPVSASAFGTHRIEPGDALPVECIGEAMIIQPLVEAISTAGEYSLMLFNGDFSHAVVKRPKPGDFRVQEYHGGVTIPAEPPPGAVDLALAALKAAPASATYARVDIVPDDEGILRIMELELIEPSLFLDYASGSEKRFASAILSAAEGLRK